MKKRKNLRKLESVILSLDKMINSVQREAHGIEELQQCRARLEELRKDLKKSSITVSEEVIKASLVLALELLYRWIESL